MLIFLFLFPVIAAAQEGYRWRLTGFGGAASLCDELGCFGPTGYSFGASFGRNMSERWSFELEGVYVHTSETLPARIDPFTGITFSPILDRSRIWGGAIFFVRLASFGEASEFFLAFGPVGGYEQQKEKAPEGIFVPPTLDIGIDGGVSGGAGFNIWFSNNWGFRPEVRYYAVANDLSGLRYTGGIIRKF
jgi:hypothetical protein